ncbi:glycosyltransferase family 2 protein [Pontibacter russatus]|uniref:glycosyltransferase family 2 protein n=1 Tax=Pontibacter russatus TaxID=2694929 RepID=UPI00137A1CCF|nr:glycosyltransferase family 2 protein [Pontibacter russatus]
MLTVNVPLFSVLIANYNNGEYLLEAIDSILKQTYKNWEIVIVDDCSIDNSQQLYKELRLNSKIKIFTNDKNRGCGYTKSRCVAEAKGELCGFLDPDDVLDLEALEIMTQKHLEQPIHSLIYSTHYEWYSKDLESIRQSNHVGSIPSNKTQLTFKGPKISHFASFKKELYLRSGGISPYLRRAVDQDLYFKLEEQGPVLFINKPLYYYRQHTHGISQGINVPAARLFHLDAIFDAYKRRQNINIDNINFKEYLNYKIEYQNLIKIRSSSIIKHIQCDIKSLLFKILLKVVF